MASKMKQRVDQITETPKEKITPVIIVNEREKNRKEKKNCY
jgi:hypothetical protein